MNLEVPAKSIPITGVGVCTPIGMTSLTSYAAFNAGLVNFSESDVLNKNGEPITVSCLGFSPKCNTRQKRVAEMVNMAMNDLMDKIQFKSSQRIAVFIGLPDTQDPIAKDLDAITQGLVLTISNYLAELKSFTRFYTKGRSAFFFALEAAIQSLNSSECDVAIVGATDSLCTPDILQKFDEEQRLLGPLISDGIIPGEGAAFVSLERCVEAARALVLCNYTGVEPKHFMQDEANLGQGLSMILKMLSRHPACYGRRTDLFYTSETGERFWSEELSFACLRNASIMPEPFTRIMAAEAFGDMGAATGAVLLGMGIHALANMQSQSSLVAPRLLLCGSSDSGNVGGCVIQGLEYNGDNTY